MKVFSPYIYSKTYFLQTDIDILTAVSILEKNIGLKLMANNPDDILNGFITKFPGGIVVAIYKIDKPPNKESPYAFKAVKITKKLEDKIYGSV